MLVAVAYDVVEDARRTRLHNRLQDFGVPVQYSVFECLLEEGDLARLRAAVGEIIDDGEDRVRIYRLCARCGDRVEIMGVGQRTEDPGAYIV
jgi:CRISPR-associated protein Cas2